VRNAILHPDKKVPIILLGRILLHMKRLSGIFIVFLALSFFFVPKSYADDPCTPITTTPDIYEINRVGSEATLYFVPVSDQIQSYTLMYGLQPEDERYSITINQGASTGAISYTVNNLEPGVEYFYKIRGDTGCTSSPWSSWVGDQTTVRGASDSAIPETGSTIPLAMAVLPFFLMLGGFGIFALATRKA
jgi:hypothetical protein